jgi:protein-tyrosine phosphatase
MAEAIDLARLAVSDGTGTVVATPHVSHVAIEELPARVAALRDALDAASVELDVRPGGELSPDDVFDLSHDQLDAIAHGPSGRRWVLLEAPLVLSRSSLATAAGAVRARGFGVLVAHPERSTAVSIDELREHVRNGSIIQINASSLAGGHGARPQRRAVELAQSGLPFVLASDAHSAARPPLLTEAAGVLHGAGVDAAVIADAVDTEPARLLRHGLPEEPRVRDARDRRRFRRFKVRAGRGHRDERVFADEGGPDRPPLH